MTTAPAGPAGPAGVGRLEEAGHASTMTRTIAALLFIAVLCDAAQAQQFSADLVRVDAWGQPAGSAGRVHVAGDKVRIETPKMADGYFVIDSAIPTAFFVRPARRVFMDAKQSSALTAVFIPVDPNDPCPRWQAMAVVAGAAEHDRQWRCERTAAETIEGREALVYRTVSPQGRRHTAAIDLQLKVPLRVTAEDGSSTVMTNIVEAPQAASLFDIPSSYGKFDPQALIERIKQSDVWVDEPR